MSQSGAVHSMTGYALVKHHITDLGYTLEIELKSVNQRFFEWQSKASELLKNHESRCRQIAQEHIHRGKLDCRISLNRLNAGGNLSINHELVATLLSSANALKEQYGTSAQLNSGELLRWPGVLQEVGATDSLEPIAPLIEDKFTELIKEFQHSRASEGERIRAFMLERLSKAEQARLAAQAIAQGLPEKFQDRLKTKLASIIDGLDPLRLEQEIVIAVQKLDVSEELDRLSTHLNEFARLLKMGGLLGKRLDFLCQELNREANTLGSKSTDIALTQQAVELKVIIEQLREQVQNVE